MTLGAKLKHFRKLVGKSQKCISKETGIPQTTLSGWEHDIGEPGISNTQKLAKALSVSIEKLLDNE